MIASRAERDKSARLMLQECVRVVAKGIPHAVDLLRGSQGHVRKTHQALQAQGVVHATSEVG